MKIRCPRCDAPMEYDLTSRKLVCAYCGNEMEYTAQNTAPYEAAVPKGLRTEEKHTEQSGMTERVCPSCGAGLIGNFTDFSSKCPYCGSVLIGTSNRNEKMPDGIIPFMVDRTGVEGALRFALTNNALIPSSFKNQNRAADLHEFFIPLWLFDLDTSSEFEGTYHDGKRFHRSRQTRGHFEKYYENWAVCGSGKHGLNEVEVRHAFRFTGIQQFKADFLAGHPAHLPDIPMAEALKAAKDQIYLEMKEEIGERISSHYYAEEVEVRRLQIDFRCESSQLILVPVWGKENRYNNQSYPTLVSGQTGRYFGNYPSSWANFGKGMFDILTKR